MSQAQLAEKSALSARAVREVEAGRSNPTLATIVSIVDALSLTLDELVSAARSVHTAMDVTRASDIAPGVTCLTRTISEPRLSAKILDVDSSETLELPAGSVFAHVLSGRAQASLEEARVVLRHGDSLHARSGVLDDLKAQGGRARILLIESVGS